MNDVLDLIGQPAVFEQLAEEAAELAQAALKYARILRGENPTPVSAEEGYEHVVEEYTDVMLCTKTLDLQLDQPLLEFKHQRWLTRIHETRD